MGIQGVTYIGRITVIKTLALSLLVQILTVLPNPPTQIMKEIQDMFYTFLWGLKLPHIESFWK
jgi:hypothetical protein